MARRKIIPKRIGAVKIPKGLRRLGDELLADPRSRQAAGRALLALGVALLGRESRRGSILREVFGHPGESAKAAREHVRDGARGAQDWGAEAASRAGEAASKGAEAVSGAADALGRVVGEVFDSIRRDVARKIRPVRPRHAHDDHDEGEGPDADAADAPRAGAADDRMH